MNKKTLVFAALVIAALGVGVSFAYLRFNKSATRNTIVANITEIRESTKQAIPNILPTPRPIPGRVILEGGSHVFQTFNNCGPASLSMSLSYYGINLSQAVIGQELRPFQNPVGDNDDKSVTLVELEAKAKYLGFATYHRPSGNVEIVKMFISNDIPVVVRTLLKEGDDIGHYRIIKGYDENKGVFIQDDSLQGKNLEYKYNDFNKLWEAYNYEYLVFFPKDKQTIVDEILGDYKDENYAWQMAVANAKDDLYGKLNKSVAYYHLGRYTDSIREFERVENQLPFRTLWYQIEPILSYYKAGNYDRVLQITENILNNNNRAFSELYELRGMIFESQGDNGRAKEEFSKARQYNSSTKEYWRENLN